MKIGVVGLGLIGGSLAKTAKLHGLGTVVGCDIDPKTIRQARLMDAIDEEMNDDNLRECSIVLVALYPGAIVEWVKSHAHLFGDGCLVIDCGGVKQCIVNELVPLTEGAGPLRASRARLGGSQAGLLRLRPPGGVVAVFDRGGDVFGRCGALHSAQPRRGGVVVAARPSGKKSTNPP